MLLNDFIFFTINDFSKDGGGTIRMKGVLNALAKSGKNVVLISNASDYNDFHPSIKHITLNLQINKQKRRIFQFVIALLPSFFSKLIFHKYANLIKKLFAQEDILNKQIISFEYFDNSMAYFFYELGLINTYINDTHGIAPLEFLHKRTDRIVDKLVNKFKYIITQKLDKKVTQKAKGLIFVSEGMRGYFEQKYSFISVKKNSIVRDGVNSILCNQAVNQQIVDKYREIYDISSNDKVILFAGNFKDMGGVMYLIEAFKILVNDNKSKKVKLLLLGDGERYDDVKNYLKEYSLDDKVILVGRTSYSELRNYQELSNVIVCPDKQHPYSELVPHIKYFDSLVSGKIVINGSFSSVREINRNEKFSIEFEPSNSNDLADKLYMVLCNLDKFTVKYKNNKKTICREFSYDNFVKALLK